MYSGWAPDDAYWSAQASSTQASAPLPQPPKHLYDPQLFYPQSYANMKNMLGMAAAAQQFAENATG